MRERWCREFDIRDSRVHHARTFPLGIRTCPFLSVADTEKAAATDSCCSHDVVVHFLSCCSHDVVVHFLSCCSHDVVVHFKRRQSRHGVHV